MMLALGSRRQPSRIPRRLAAACLCAAVLSPLGAHAGGGVVSTVYPRNGDGGLASSSILTARALAVDADGNLFFSDRNRIRRVDAATTQITTIAGTGLPEFSGDGGPAADAAVRDPSGLAFDGGGNLYLADTGNQRIRRIDPDGQITTIAGNGVPAYAGDGGPAIQAGIRLAGALAADRVGNVFFADLGPEGPVVRKIDPAGTIARVAGGGTCIVLHYIPPVCNGLPATSIELTEIPAIAVDGTGSLYIAQPRARTVLRVLPGGTAIRYAGTGAEGSGQDGLPAPIATVSGPVGLAVDAQDNLYIADRNNWRIRKVSREGIISWHAGAGTYGYSGDGGDARRAAMRPSAIAVDSRPGPTPDLFIVDALGTVIRRIRNGTMTRYAGAGRVMCGGIDFFPDMPVAPDQLCGWRDFAIDAEGRIYAAASNGQEIRRLDPATGAVTVIARGGSDRSEDIPALDAFFASIVSVSIAGGDLYVASWGSGSFVRRIDLRTGLVRTVAGRLGQEGYGGDGGRATGALLNAPYDVAAGPDGTVFVADSENCRVRRVTPEGTITTVAGTGECGTGGDDGPAISARLDRPRGVAVRDSTLYIADSYSGRVRAVDLVAGTITTVAGGGPCCDPGDGGSAAGAYLPFAEKIALGPGGDLYVTDGIYAVRRVDPSGIISTVAGNFDPNALCPDGSDSTECGFDHPTEAIPFGDDLYVAETWGLRHIDLG